MKKIVTVLVTIAFAALALAGCGVPSPCLDIPAPTPRQLEVAAETDYPTEVEKTVRGVECDLDVNTRTWTEEPTDS